MNSAFLQKFGRVLSSLLIVVLLTPSWGCALLVNKQKQQIQINTNPPGRTIYIKGSPVKDGQSFTISKQFEAAEANVGTASRPTNVELKFDPDPWIIGDIALFIPFIIPGIIGLAVDIGGGTWRKYRDPQILMVPESAAPIVEPKPAESTPAPEVKKPAPKAPSKTPAKPKPSKPAEAPAPEPSPIQP